VEVLNPERSLSRHPLFQVMLALQNTPDTAEFELQGLDVQPEPVKLGTVNFDLSVIITEAPAEGNALHGLDGEIEYRADVFDRGTVERFAEYYQRFLTAIATDPCQRVSQVDILTQDEQRTLAAWNDTARDIPQGTFSDFFGDPSEPLT
jgi:non-ribosomal peptide synthetase component F